MDDATRRTAFAAALGLTAGAALVLPGCAKPADEADVSATEDLMREHGVLRRILVIYRSVAPILRSAPDKLDAVALAEATRLFQSFGEDYHERKLEERHIFPTVEKLGGEAGALVPVLQQQHVHGRQITGFILAKCAAGKVLTGDAEPLARALESFAAMYEAHTAFEDTIVFQAWRKALGAKALDAMAAQFEDMEKGTFRGDGFQMAVGRVAAIEQRLGLHDLARLTPPPVAS
jgi:hemerythrin-like domain-containing protein